MKGQIFLPKYYRDRWTDNYKALFRLCHEHYGWTIHYNDAPEIKKDTRLAMLFGVPQHNRPSLMVDQFASLPKHIKLIAFCADIQSYGNKKCEETQRRIFTRADLIIGQFWIYFNKYWAEFLDKYVFMPQWFSTYDRYAQLPFNNTPMQKCLISGAINPKYYPIRHSIARSCDPIRVHHILPPYWGQHNYKGDKYAELLSSYLCGVGTSGIEGSDDRSLVKKHLEIPAAGSLLLSDVLEEHEMIGLKPGEHFIPITKDNALEQIYEVLGCPERYIKMRQKARQFVLENHSEKNRFEQLQKILRERMF